MASTLGNEAVGFYDPNVDNEFKLLMLDVHERVLDLLERPEASGHQPQSLASCMFDQLKNLADYAKDVAAQCGINVNATVNIEGENIPVYDYSVPTYAAFEAEAAGIKSILDATVPDFLTAYPTICAGWGRHDFNMAASVGDAARWFVSKLLGALGLTEGYAGFLAALEAVAGDLLKELGEALRNRAWKKAIKIIVKILKVIATKKFRNRLIQEVGEAAAKKIIGKILARAVPFLGWAILAAELLWAIAEAIF